MRNIDEIIVHCTATPRGRAVKVADIDRWHHNRGFAGIGYHYVIMLDGTVCRGRNVERIGAHCKGHNARSIGVAYVGGVEADCTTAADTRTDKQKKALRALLAELKRRYPAASIRGHRDFAPKACPSFDAAAEYSDI